VFCPGNEKQENKTRKEKPNKEYANLYTPSFSRFACAFYFVTGKTALRILFTHPNFQKLNLPSI